MELEAAWDEADGAHDVDVRFFTFMVEVGRVFMVEL